MSNISSRFAGVIDFWRLEDTSVYKDLEFPWILKYLGRTALFTDRTDLTDEEIVTGYRSAWHVEAAFKQMKNTDHLTVRPLFHWTDEKNKGTHFYLCTRVPAMLSFGKGAVRYRDQNQH